MVPEQTRTLLYSGGSWRLPGEDDGVCEGAKFHTPTPMFTHHTRVIPDRWGINPGHSPSVSLCGTCRDNLAMLMELLRGTEGKLSWPVRREFGNVIRDIAARGWAKYVEITTPQEP